MSYEAGIGPGLAAMLGRTPHGPRVKCDACGVVLDLSGRRIAPAWLLDGGAPPGWRMVRGEGGKRTDTCGRCREGEQR